MALMQNKGDFAPLQNRLQTAEIETLQQKARAVQMPTMIQEALRHIWVQHKEVFKEDARERLSDRRLIKAVKLLSFSAASNERTEVNLSDLLLLKNCLWNHPDNASKVLEIIKNTLQQFNKQVPVDAVEVQDASGKWVAVGTSQKQANLPVTQTNRAVVAIKTIAPAKKGSVVKGWMGSGTEADPLQVTCIEDLLELAEPHIGQNGYYFVQTADIDGSQVSTWNDIAFQGHYDGRGFSVIAPKDKTIFSNVINSSFNNIEVQGSGYLVGFAKDSIFKNCSAVHSLIYSSSSSSNASPSTVSNCTITACSAGDFLICSSSTDNSSTVSNCTITACSVGRSLICSSSSSTSTVSNCTITACSAGSSLIYSSSTNNSSTVSNCTITACSVGSSLIYSSSYSYDSTVSNCTVTACLSITTLMDFGKTRSNYRKFEGTTFNTCALVNGFWANGKTLDAAQWKQRYFENNMGWDFDNVWVWNDAENRPELRYVGVGAVQPQAKPQNPQEGMEDLLGVELRENIWL
jgi:MoxR-like ATPase